MSGHVDVLGVMDCAARRISRECRACVDPIACTGCDMAKPMREARAAVAKLIDAADDLVNYQAADHEGTSLLDNDAVWERAARALARLSGAPQ